MSFAEVVEAAFAFALFLYVAVRLATAAFYQSKRDYEGAQDGTRRRQPPPPQQP